MGGNTIVSSRSRKNSIRRWYYQRFVKNQLPEKQVMMIMGAQRSGTTLLSRIFDDLPFAEVYGEFSDLSSEDRYGLRLNSPDAVNRVLDRSLANLVVMKPLVESQKAEYWLANIPRSKAVWIYRDYVDVVSSSVVKFGPVEGGLSHARAFADPDFAKRDCTTWKSENASSKTKEIVSSYYLDDMPAHDAAALFWYARNVLYMEKQMDKRADTILIRYEDLVRYPFLVISYLLQQFGIFELKSTSIFDIDTKSVGKGKDLGLPPEIDDLCSELHRKLTATYNRTPLGKMLEALNLNNTDSTVAEMISQTDNSLIAKI